MRRKVEGAIVVGAFVVTVLLIGARSWPEDIQQWAVGGFVIIYVAEVLGQFNLSANICADGLKIVAAVWGLSFAIHVQDSLPPGGSWTYRWATMAVLLLGLMRVGTLPWFSKRPSPSEGPVDAIVDDDNHSPDVW